MKIRTTRFWLRFILLMAAMFAALYFCWRLFELVKALFIAGIVSYLLYRPVQWMHQRGMPRGLAVITFYLIFVLLGIGIIMAFLPHISEQIEEFNQLLIQAENFLLHLPAYLVQYHIPLEAGELIVQELFKGKEMVLTTLQSFAAGGHRWIQLLIPWVLAPVFTFYYLTDGEILKQGFYRLFTPYTRWQISAALLEIDTAVMGYFKGQLLTATIIGAFLGVVAMFLGVPYAFIIFLLSVIGNLIPYFGQLISAIPAILLSAPHSPTAAWTMLVAVILIQQVDAVWLTPKIVGNRADLKPLMVILALMAGGALGGIAGILLAIPIISAGRIVLRQVYLQLV